MILGPDGAAVAVGAVAVGTALVAGRAIGRWMERRMHGDFRISIECGAAAQFEHATAADLSAFDCLAGQITQDNDKDGDADPRLLGESVAEFAARAGKLRGAWSYVYTPSDAEVRRLAGILLDAIQRHRLEVLYLDPEAEVRSQGAIGRRRVAELAEYLRAQAPQTELIYNGMVAILDSRIARACHSAAPMIYPLGQDGRPVPLERQADLIARVWRERVALCREAGLEIVRPTIFPAGHSYGGPSPELLASLTKETRTHGATFFQAAGAITNFNYRALAAALRGAR